MWRTLSLVFTTLVFAIVGFYVLVLYNGEGRHWAWLVVSPVAFALSALSAWFSRRSLKRLG